MAKISGAKPARKPAGEKARSAPDEPSIQFGPPLKPHRRLFIGLSVVFAAWIAFLLVLYFTQVFPHRNDAAHGQQLPASQRSESR